MSARSLAIFSLSAVLAGCAKSVMVPEIKLDPVDTKPVASSAPIAPSIRVVEVPKPLPLPGQLKPLPQRDVVAP